MIAQGEDDDLAIKFMNFKVDRQGTNECDPRVPVARDSPSS